MKADFYQNNLFLQRYDIDPFGLFFKDKLPLRVRFALWMLGFKKVDYEKIVDERRRKIEEACEKLKKEGKL